MFNETQDIWLMNSYLAGRMGHYKSFRDYIHELTGEQQRVAEMFEEVGDEIEANHLLEKMGEKFDEGAAERKANLDA